MSLLEIAIIALVVVLILSLPLPIYPYGRSVGPYPSTVAALVLLIVVLWALFGNPHAIR
jgi:hypothetical protein